jgi:hypothetical protein
MTRGIGFQPKVQLTFSPAATGEQVKAIAPRELELHLTMLSEKKLTRTFSEMVNSAWLAVLKMLHGPIFDTWDSQENQKHALAVDVLGRLNKVPIPDGGTEKLGDLVAKWFHKKGKALSFDDDFKTVIETKVLPEIARDLSNRYYEQYEQKLLDLVQQKGFSINPANPQHEDMRKFVRY